MHNLDKANANKLPERDQVNVHKRNIIALIDLVYRKGKEEAIARMDRSESVLKGAILHYTNDGPKRQYSPMVNSAMNYVVERYIVNFHNNRTFLP